MHVGHGRTNLHWRPLFAHKTFSRQILKFKQRTNVPYLYHHTKGVPYQRSVPVPLQKKRTVPAYRTSWQKLRRTVPTYRTVLPSLISSSDSGILTDKFDVLRGRLLGNHNDFHWQLGGQINHQLCSYKAVRVRRCTELDSAVSSFQLL